MGKNVVIGGYYTGSTDWQRGFKEWSKDYTELEPLIDSIKPGIELAILHDCFEGVTDSEYVKHIRLPVMHRAGAWVRWIRAHAYLLMNQDIEYAFMVDSTDVQMVKDPFPFLEKGKLYLGDETKLVDNDWMRAFHGNNETDLFIKKYGTRPLFNCGICGGDRDILIEFTGKMVDKYYQFEGDNRHGIASNLNSDMGIFNMLAHQEYAGRVEHGPHINTKFGHWEPYETATAWWKHK
ncbi:hypothetical protein SB5439_04995 [Klebsiella variicola]|uniref:hypothetical protein n=1 Tax=Klebsiella variicola TaxID=244366 RepID=UPI00109CD1A2|nr:hypothetical protein [Klebsiella variicola]VGQ11787.1 hypothetical protein SB5439_04995 [Klebsiella variicola]